MLKQKTTYCHFDTEEEAIHHCDNVLSVNIPKESRGYEKTESGWRTWWVKEIWVNNEVSEYEES